jgi:beta-galactosidase
MHKFKGRLAFSILSAVLVGCSVPSGNTVNDRPSPESSSSRFHAPVKFNNDWLFTRSNDILDLQRAQELGGWESVSLPHTARIEPRIVNDQWQGDAWYKKTIAFRSEWEGKKVILDFEGAMNEAEVWLNDEKIKHHLGGYLPFSVDLTDKLRKTGGNTLYVRLDNRDNPTSGPKPLDILDFSMYGGIYRNVWLRVENPLHITDPVNAGKVASGGIFVRYPKVSPEAAQVWVQTHLVNDGDASTVTVRQTLLDGEKQLGSKDASFNVRGQRELEVVQTLNVSSPELWSPDNPKLYQLKTEVLVDGELWDRETTRIGIRRFELVGQDLYINGEKTFLRGVNRHQEYPYIGYALSDAAQYRDAEKIKSAGFDYVRLSHYPHSKAFMAAADELGLVLIDAILGWQYVGETQAFKDHVVQTCRDMIRRDRNHPSVLAWECSLNESAMGKPLIDRLHGAVHEEFPGEYTYSAGWVNYAYDVYLHARQHRLGHELDTKGKPYVVSEYGDWEYYAMNAGLNQDDWQDLKQADRSSRQLLSDGEKRLQQQVANVSEAHNDNFSVPAFADGYWVMFDYNRGYADDLEASGVMSLERRPKFSYYFFQSQRDADKYAGPLAGGYMAHIASHWMPDSSLNIKVYSNAEAVDLYLNGEKVGEGRHSGEYSNLKHQPFEFALDAFEPGTLEARALVDGEVVASHEVATPGAPAKLTTWLEESSLPPQTGVKDVVFVYAQLQDAEGHNSRVNGEPVRFEVKGDAELLSPATLYTEDGVAAALVRVGQDLESVRISASAKNLEADGLRLIP